MNARKRIAATLTMLAAMGALFGGAAVASAEPADVGALKVVKCEHLKCVYK